MRGRANSHIKRHALFLVLLCERATALTISPLPPNITVATPLTLSVSLGANENRHEFFLEWIYYDNQNPDLTDFIPVSNPSQAFEITLTATATGRFQIAAVDGERNPIFSASQTIFAISEATTVSSEAGPSVTAIGRTEVGASTGGTSSSNMTSATYTTMNPSSVTTPSRSGDNPKSGASSSSRERTKAIVGGTVGGGAALFAVGVLIILLRRRSTRPLYPFNFERLNRQRRQSFGITALPLPDSPLLQPTRLAIHRKSPRTGIQSPRTETSLSPAEMGERKERMLENEVETGAADAPLQHPDGETYQHSTETGREQPNGQTRDPEMLARKLDIVVQRLAQLEARFDEEAPPDYTSNRS